MKNLKNPFIMLALILFFTSVFCRSESSIQAEKRKTEISIETQSIPSETIVPANAETLPSLGTADDLTTIAPNPTQLDLKSSTPQQTPLCYCNREYKCNLFATQKDAQVCFDHCNGSKTNNWSNLDPDHDGVICEELP